MIEYALAASLAILAPDDDRADAAARATRAAADTPARWERYEDCVADRESGNSPTARNSQSTAAGKYQFLDSQWRDGLAFMVANRLKQFGMPKPDAKRIRITLQDTHIARWPAIYQQIGFNEVVTQGGAHHWRLPGSRCETYR
jgi:hypothetical protein